MADVARGLKRHPRRERSEPTERTEPTRKEIRDWLRNDAPRDVRRIIFGADRKPWLWPGWTR